MSLTILCPCSDSMCLFCCYQNSLLCSDQMYFIIIILSLTILCPFLVLFCLELQNADGKVDISAPGFDDPYLKYGGTYATDPKDSADFKYVQFTEMPKFTPAHKSAMAKYLTPEVREYYCYDYLITNIMNIIVITFIIIIFTITIIIIVITINQIIIIIIITL